MLSSPTSERSAILVPLLLALAACGDGALDDDAVCGDGVVAASEGCDDGNLQSQDGCSPTCTLDPGYVCEAGGPCRTPCGDGIVAGEEACDDGNASSGDGCSETCTNESVIGFFRAVTGADPNEVVTSNEITINIEPGILVTASTTGRYDERIVVDGTERGPTARVTRGQQVALRMSAPAGFSDNRATVFILEDLRLEWRLSTRTSTFGWQTGAFGPCTSGCGEGIRVRDVICVDELGRGVDDALCPDPPPPSAEICEDFSECTYAYGPWTPWSDCQDGLRRRSRDCRREDGAAVACELCGGICTGEGPCNIDCTQRGGLVINCSPRAPGDKVACDAALSTAVARCLDVGCALAASSDTECTVGGFEGVPQCYGGEVVCE